MISIKNFFTVLIFSGSFLLFSCDTEGGRSGSQNAPEIIDRTSEDTVFNQVPGKAHHGREHYENAGDSEQ